MDANEFSSTKNARNIFRSHGCFKTPKINEQFSDCQDSYALSTSGSRVAISDGATQSFYSGIWAQTLCDLYCSWPSPISQTQWVEWSSFAQSHWNKQVNEKLDELKKAGRPSWIECLNGLKLKKEAFATFVGITLGDSYLHGICIGDSCAMLVKQTQIDQCNLEYPRGNSIIRIFPGLWQHSFDSRTSGLSSYNSESHHLPEFFDIPIPADKEDYRILLMTDALADYVIKMERKGMSVLSSLLSIGNQDDFARYITESRETGLANDDVTLVIVEIANVDEPLAPIDILKNIEDTISSIADSQQAEEEHVDTSNESSGYQPLQPYLEPLPLALPPGSNRTMENRSPETNIHNRQEASPSCHNTNDLYEADEELQSMTKISSQTPTHDQSSSYQSNKKAHDTRLDNNIEASSPTIELPDFSGKKNEINLQKHPTIIHLVRRKISTILTRLFRT